MTVKRTLRGLLAIALLAMSACAAEDEPTVGSTTTAGTEATVSPAAEGVTASQTFTKADSGKEVPLAVGEEVVAALETCVGCGYRWEITEEPDAAVVESLGSTNQPRTGDTQPGDPPIAGGSSDELFSFRGVGAGTAKVTIGYFPPAGDSPEETFTLSFSVA